MSHGETELDGGEAGRQGRRDVADYQDQVGTDILQDRLESLHDGRQLMDLGAGADPEKRGGFRELQVAEERVGHELVVMLAGVHDVRSDAGVPPHLRLERRQLHEVRPAADHVKYFQALHPALHISS